MSSQTKAQAFLSMAHQFQLGGLVTESFHPLTSNLSQLSISDVKAAFKLLQQVDHLALTMIMEKQDELWELAQEIQATLQAGHKVFMCGCGATGRLSLVLETLMRQSQRFPNQIFSFMAGGDFALIKSVESFEDRPDFGERQLMELGFGPEDLLVASTEGGETPFVIGAAIKASTISKRSPYFLYCNPDEALNSIERSMAVIHTPHIRKVNLTVGPMAISGSTRMQASTVLMLSIGVGLLYDHKNESQFGLFLQDLIKRLKETDYSRLASLTQLEAKLYQEGKYVNYLAHEGLAISILTDTTERSPTFSLQGFENLIDDEVRPSLSYLFIPNTFSSEQAWQRLLRRAPRPLGWGELQGRIALPKVLGFDISEFGLKHRQQRLVTESFEIEYVKGKVSMACTGEKVLFEWGEDLLFNHLMVKMLLNAHSTAIMGILGRYEGNVMTFVRPSNNKLIDRAARYVLQLLKQSHKTASYEDVVTAIFQEMEELQENEPIVLKVLERL